MKKIQNINILLLLSSFFSILLVLFRIGATSTLIYTGLIWNLFLAWIPYILSNFLKQNLFRFKSRFIVLIWIGTWLLFFPNAPYILTDLFHLHEKGGVPMWYDLVLIFTFVWNGLLLGMISLLDLQKCVTEKTSENGGWFFVFAVTILAGFGIYLGRYLRWNSWDIITNPVLLSKDIIEIILNPMIHQKAFGVTILFSAFMLVFYVVFINLFLPEKSLKTKINFNMKNKN